MFTRTIFTAVACSMLARHALAHMVITSPVPYGIDTLTNSPLENDGSDFPCKQRTGAYDISSMNHMPVGVPQTLSFKGGATHGGGSCQVSVTLDKEPTQNSEWKVIHSIVGGCPSNTTGNLSDDADGTNASVFEFSIPKGMPNGQYSLAWTWFNKIGNREMYMNCAPIEVTGGADNNDVFKTLPDMFVINIPNESCGTVEGEDFNFPSPGLYAETPFKTALGSSTTGSGCASVTAKGAGSGAAGTPAPASGGASSAASYAASSAPASYAAPQATSAAATAQNINSPVTVTTMATVTGSGNTAAVSSAAAPAASADSSQSGSGSTSGNDSASSSGSVACSSPGAVVCIGSNQFGICNTDNTAVPQALAAGTTCSGGKVMKRTVTRHAQRHIGALGHRQS